MAVFQKVLLVLLASLVAGVEGRFLNPDQEHFHRLAKRDIPRKASSTVPRYMLRLYEQRQLSGDDVCNHPIIYNLGNLGHQEGCTTLSLKFNLSSISTNHAIAAARLHLELDSDSTDTAETLSRKLRVRLHHMRPVKSNDPMSEVRQILQTHRRHSTEDGRKLLHSKSLIPSAATDLVLDITKAAIEVRQSAQSVLEMILTVDAAPSSCQWIQHFAAMMEVEIEGPSCNNNDVDEEEKRKKRSVTASDVREDMLKAKIHSEVLKNQRAKRSTASQWFSKDVANSMCKRKPMRVLFENIGWDDWVVAPSAYDAYMCEGTCPFPVNDNLNATNHAILQNLLHFNEPDNVPPACCVPTGLIPISMLYYDANDNLVLKVYEDMAVNACGCH